jgi:cytochrome c oxidase subunit III
MAETVLKQAPQVVGGGGGDHATDGGFGDGGSGGGLPHGTARRAYRTGMLMALIGISMLFIAFTSAYVVRAGLGDDWVPIGLPRLLWWNAGLLLASSVTIELTCRALNQGLRSQCNAWLGLTALLGTGFLAGQLTVWRQLAERGVFLATNPSSSFFYLLSGTHAIHLFGGLVALFYIVWEAWRYRLGPAKRTLVEVTAIYWHFMDGLWIYILLLLSYWR